MTKYRVFFKETNLGYADITVEEDESLCVAVENIGRDEIIWVSYPLQRETRYVENLETGVRIYDFYDGVYGLTEDSYGLENDGDAYGIK